MHLIEQLMSNRLDNFNILRCPVVILSEQEGEGKQKEKTNSQDPLPGRICI